MIAFGGLNWALDGAVGAGRRRAAARAGDGAGRRAARPATARPPALPAREIRFRDVTFAYPGGAPVLDHFDLTIPAGSSLAIVGQNGAGKTTLAKLLCRLYDPQSGAIEIDGVDLRELSTRRRGARASTAVFQDFIRFELPLRDNVAPARRARRRRPRGARRRPAPRTSPASTRCSRAATTAAPISRAASGSASRSRARCAPSSSAPASCCSTSRPRSSTCAAKPEIFDRILAATRHCTTILISHRFSTVRHADRICVLEHGRVVELGTHDELMALGGRYRTMFDLQAQRFGAAEDEEGTTYDVLG